MSFMMISSLACSKPQPLETVKSVDLNRYMGKWYEIALFPQRFERGCNCTQAEYVMEKDFVRVINSCNKESATGELSIAKGKAFVVKGSNNTKLKVQFFWPFKGDYWIIDLAEDYSYAVVGAPDRKYLWILSRTPVMEDSLYNQITERVKQKGFDITKLVKTNQKCN